MPFKIGNTWYMDVSYKGKRIRKALPGVKTKREAKAIEDKYRLKLLKQELLGEIEPEPITLKQALDEYIKKHSEPHLSPKQVEREKGIVKKLLDYFGEYKQLCDITQKDIEDYLFQQLQTVKPATANRELAFLKSFFRKCEEWDYIVHNPARKIKKFKEPPGRLRYLSPDEMQRFLKAVDEEKPLVRAFILTGFYTGMRKSEISKLKWKDIDFENDLIIVQESKNNEKRTIKMVPQLKKILQSLPRRSEYVFYNPETKKPVYWIESAWKRILKKAGIQDFRFHDLRHNFASYLIMSGNNIRVVQSLLGHKTIQMTARYAHVSDARKQEAIEGFNQHIGEILNDSKSENRR